MFKLIEEGLKGRIAGCTRSWPRFSFSWPPIFPKLTFGYTPLINN